ncbi:unnamed protein product [Phytophthora fragariaefolia]|uniref:Unnamed protein product n=1 Tax=Phytophthora fragariaefolia TaxID=1490495 RepID=A0A9W6XTG1_9STRA|nr:unnamed protein product [Phytophthora fragariaefolia]
MQADPGRTRTGSNYGEESTAVARAMGDGNPGGAAATSTEVDQTTEMLQLLRGVVGRLDKLEESQTQIQKQLETKNGPKTISDSSLFESALGRGYRMHIDALSPAAPMQMPRRPAVAPQYFGLRHADVGAHDPGISELQRPYAVERDAQAAQEAPQPPAAPLSNPKWRMCSSNRAGRSATQMPARRNWRSARSTGRSSTLDWDPVFWAGVEGSTVKYYNKQVDSWWSQYPSLQYVMEKMLDAFKTNITPAQAMKLFTAPKDGKRSWPEYYMYLVAIPEATENSDYMVLTNIVRHASAELRTVLMAEVDQSRTDFLTHAEELAHFAQSWEAESTQKKSLGRETVNAKAGDNDGLWILDNASSRHLVNDESYIEDVEEYSDACVQPNGEPLNITKRGKVTLRVTACGEEQVMELNDVDLAKDVPGAHGFCGGVGRRAARHAAGLPLSHLNYDTVELLAKDPSSGIYLTDHKRVNCLTCAEGKQTKSRRSKKDTGTHSPIDRVGGVICSDLKGPMTPKARLGNRYMVNFVDFKSNYCRVFLARTKDAAAKLFEHFLVFFEREFNCKVHVLRTDSGREYEKVDLICKRTGVTRQRSEARNQFSNGKAERMRRTIMNMARCMIFACGLPLKFWGDAVQYAAYILNRAPTNSNLGRASPLKVLTGKSPPLGEIVVFGSPCTVYRDPRTKNFAQRAQTALIVDVGEETKGYRVYLPKDRVMVTTQHVTNIESLDKEQNLQVQRLYLQGDETLEGDEAHEIEGQAPVAEATSARSKKKRASSKKTPWARERHVTRSVAKNAEGVTNEATQLQEPVNDVVNCVTEHDPKSYQVAMRSKLKHKWLAAMAEELRALEDNGVWRVVPACPAKHGDVPNAYVQADKEAELDIFLRLPRGMMIPDNVRKRLGVANDSELVLELMKALYGLKQAGRLWNQLLHKTLIKLGFAQSLTDMCVYHRRREGVLVVVGVYIDDLLVTKMQQQADDVFFGELTELPIKDLGPASKFLGMRVTYNEDEGYDFDQELAIEEMLREHGMESAHSVRTPIGAESNEIDEASDQLLPTSGGDGAVHAT